MARSGYSRPDSIPGQEPGDNGGTVLKYAPHLLIAALGFALMSLGGPSVLRFSGSLGGLLPLTYIVSLLAFSGCVVVAAWRQAGAKDRVRAGALVLGSLGVAADLGVGLSHDALPAMGLGIRVLAVLLPIALLGVYWVRAAALRPWLIFLATGMALGANAIMGFTAF